MKQVSETNEETPGGVSLSYKFQRLREQLRSAIMNGELGDRLPGERELGRRYHANAKTINKALCDLSSEGLLVRQIGRGTFVSKPDQAVSATAHPRVWRSLVAGRTESHRRNLVESVRAQLSPFDTFESLESLYPTEIPLNAWPVTKRSKTDGLLIYPADPLFSDAGRPSASLIAELWRRHVVAVLVGSASAHAKLTAVMPDYVDAGFRLTEYLIGLGCENLVTLMNAGAGPEAQQVYVGAQTAGARHRTNIGRATLGESSGAGGWSVEKLREGMNGSGVAGLICVGSTALETALSDPDLTNARREGRVAVVCILEPGQVPPEGENITSYQVDLNRISQMAARLLIETRSADRPVEVIIPGRLVIAEGAAQEKIDMPGPHRVSDSRRMNAVAQISEVRV